MQSDPSNDLAARVIAIIAKQDDTIDASKVGLTTTLKELKFDSFGAVSLMFDLEEAFHVELTDRNLNDVKTVGDIVDLLQKLREGRGENV